MGAIRYWIAPTIGGSEPGARLSSNHLFETALLRSSRSVPRTARGIAMDLGTARLGDRVLVDGDAATVNLEVRA